jgi:hypothetical protein
MSGATHILAKGFGDDAWGFAAWFGKQASGK